MANFTLDYTGAEVNALLGQVAAGGSGGGGVMRVNFSAEGMDESMQLINVTADKTHDEIVACIENGGYAVATFDSSMLGAPAGSLNFMTLSDFIPMDGNINVTFILTIDGGSLAVYSTANGFHGGLLTE